MNVGWLQELLPPANTLTTRGTACWLLFFLLFPLAYAGGALLQFAEERPARISNAVDRAKSIQLAGRFALSKGVAVNGWNHYAIAQTDDNLLALYDSTMQPDLAALSTVAPARQVEVLFRSADGREEFRVYLSLDGRVIGFSSERSGGKTRFEGDWAKIQIHTADKGQGSDRQQAADSARALNNAAVEAVARNGLLGYSKLTDLVKLGTSKITVNPEDPTLADVAWDASLENSKGIMLHITESVRDGRIVAQRIKAGVNGKQVQPKRTLPVVLNVSYGFFLSIGAIYAIYRYAKRTLQKEVSHLRTLVVAGLFTVSYSVFVFSLAVDQVAVRVSGEVLMKITWVSYITSSVIFILMGLLVGIGYGSGEGEVREAFGGKLVSLDALLAGRIVSKDVGASVLFGAASAGWLLLLHNAFSYFARGEAVAFRNDVLTYTFARLPWLTLLVGTQYDALLIAVTGLLLPAAFLARGRRNKRRFAWLVLFAMLSVLRDAAKYPSAASTWLSIVVFASALLLPFFAFDLLAAIVSLSALSYATALARLSAIVPPWTGFSLGLAGVAAAALAVAIYFALRGERVQAEQVRPQYAKNLAERMSMQAEILAAREAQLRLLPQEVPKMAGIELAACCLPAQGVGGDFYDFFPLTKDQVGIFVAQGGEQGLASALRIALAKGVLMHASTQLASPREIVLDLEGTIGDLLEGGSEQSISFAYGVMDTTSHRLSYARIGESPRLLINRRGLQRDTRAELECVVAVENRPSDAPRVSEGSSVLEEGDSLMFFTAGIAGLRSKDFGNRDQQWLRALLGDLGRQTTLQMSLISTLAKYQKQTLYDLTAVVLRVDGEAAMQPVVV